MGMGEPFANPNLFDALKNPDKPVFVRIKPATHYHIDDWNDSGIKRLTRDFPQVNLAFRCTRLFEKQRSELMPINQTYPLHKVMDALDAHVANTKRRLFPRLFMLGGINDSGRSMRKRVRRTLFYRSVVHSYHVGSYPI